MAYINTTTQKTPQSILNKALPYSAASLSSGIYSAPKKTPPISTTTQTTVSPQNTVAPTAPVAPKPSGMSDIYSQLGNIQKGLQSLTPPKPETPTGTTAGIFPTVASSLASFGSTPSKAVTDAIEYERQLKENVAQKTADIYSDPVSARVMQGRDSAMQQANLEKLTAASNAVTQAQTQQQLQQSALGTAGQLTQPVQVPYGNQYIDPTTGQMVGGGQAGGGLNVQSLAQQVISGQISPSQADAMLGNNLGLTTQLNQTILGMNPQFNRVEAEARAGATTSEIGQTGTTGGMLTKAADNATKAMGTLQHAYGLLADIQKTQVPGWNKLVTGLSGLTGVGIAETQAYNTALQEARAAVSSVLSAAGNTPTFSDSTASAILPEGAGPDQINAAITTIQELINQKVSSFTNSGQQSGTVVNTSAGPIKTNW